MFIAFIKQAVMIDVCLIKAKKDVVVSKLVFVYANSFGRLPADVVIYLIPKQLTLLFIVWNSGSFTYGKIFDLVLSLCGIVVIFSFDKGEHKRGG